MRLPVVPVVGSMGAAGKLTMSGLSFKVAITRAFEIPLSTAFAAAEQEQREKDQGQYTTSDCATDDVLVARRTRPISNVSPSQRESSGETHTNVFWVNTPVGLG